MKKGIKEQRMTRQNVAYNEHLDDYVSKNPDMDFGEVSGIKLRESLFVVYSFNDSVSGSEFVYNLKSMNGTGEMVFDNDMSSVVSSGGAENRGAYRLEDDRILQINSMEHWHFKGFIFKDEQEWVQYSEYVDRNSVNS